MTSQVNPNNIDGTYPVAGQDNDSQGFRDNFTNIRNNFTYVKAELEDLQNKAVLKTALTNTTLDNDFAGNVIANPSLKSFREEIYTIASGSTATVDFSRGNLQRIILTVPTTLSFSFPSNTSGQYASVKLWVEVSDPANTLTLPNSVTLGDPDTIAGLTGTAPPVITFSSTEIGNNTKFLFEFYTIDAGTTIGIRDLVRNRDIALTSFAIAGDLTANGAVTLGSAGANVTIAGSLVTTGPRINTNFAYVTLTNDQDFFANTDFQTLFFDTASSATIANARIALPSTAINGTELNLSFLAPVTSVWVNTGNTSLVKWFPNSSVSSGNVAAKFVYSTAASNWLRSL